MLRQQAKQREAGHGATSAAARSGLEGGSSPTRKEKFRVFEIFSSKFGTIV